MVFGVLLEDQSPIFKNLQIGKGGTNSGEISAKSSNLDENPIFVDIFLLTVFFLTRNFVE